MSITITLAISNAATPGSTLKKTFCMPRSNWQLLHPRQFAGLSALEKQVFDAVRRLGQVHPRDLEAELGRERTVNAWGGYSKSTTQALHQLHYRGLLRIAGREQGIRVYEATASFAGQLAPNERLKRITLLLAGIFAPLPLPSLREIMRFLARAAPNLSGRLHMVGDLIKSGELQTADVEGLKYVWPAGAFRAQTPPPTVRLLAPFDPLVWDRRRFEHLWGWRYRFEAYTPPSKRKLGYYAMPVLWGSSIIGWANVSVQGARISVKLGYVNGRPRDSQFHEALRAEIQSFKQFL